MSLTPTHGVGSPCCIVNCPLCAEHETAVILPFPTSEERAKQQYDDARAWLIERAKQLDW